MPLGVYLRALPTIDTVNNEREWKAEDNGSAEMRLCLPMFVKTRVQLPGVMAVTQLSRLSISRTTETGSRSWPLGSASRDREKRWAETTLSTTSSVVRAKSTTVNRFLSPSNSAESCLEASILARSLFCSLVRLLTLLKSKICSTLRYRSSVAKRDVGNDIPTYQVKSYPPGPLTEPFPLEKV